jgi:hypothetical protein
VFGDKYSRTNKRTLGAATAIQKIRGVMSRYEDKDGNVKEGGVPGFGEVESVIGARGPWTRAIAGIGNSDEYNADAETILAAGRNAVNLVLRDESGAAAPVPEHVETVIRAGFEPGASEAQARESLKQMEELVYSRLNADAVSHPERARAILEAQGLDPKRIRAVVASQKTATDEGGTTPPPPAPSTAGNDEGERALTPEEAAETYHVKATMPDGTKVDKVLTLAEVDDLRKNRARIHSSIESSLETTGPDAGDTQSFTPKPVRGTPAPLGRSPTKEELQGLVDELGVRKKVKR